MPFPLVPVAMGALAMGAAYTARKRKRVAGLTPERQKVYEAALKTLKDPAKLRTLADSFQKEGLNAEAELLRKRAVLRELPADVKAGRRAAFRKGMASKDKAAVLRLAEAFAKEGCTGAAAALREYAAGLT